MVTTIRRKINQISTSMIAADEINTVCVDDSGETWELDRSVPGYRWIKLPQLPMVTMTGEVVEEKW